MTQVRSSLHNRLGAVGSVLAAAILLAGLTGAREPKPDNLVPAGEPVNCLTLRQIQSTQVRDDQTIDFEVANHKIYRNILPARCPGLGFEEKYLFVTSGSQICSIDIITVLQSLGSGFQRGASCGLGKFQPMEKAAQ